MRSKITVVGERGRALAQALAAGDRADVVSLQAPSPDLSGSDVVVLAGGDVGVAAGDVARRAPAAVVVVATGDAETDCQRVVDVSLLPRPRIVGVPPERVAEAVEAVLYGRDLALSAAVLCRGEHGVDDRVATVPVRLGRGGVRRIE